jgi:hypothetical protein
VGRQRATANNRALPASSRAAGTGHSAAKWFGIIALVVLLAFIFLMGIMMIAMSVTATKPDPSAASFKIPDTLPKELFTLDKCLPFWNRNLRNGLVVYDEGGIKVNIEYPSAIKSVHRNWYGSSAYLLMNGVKVEGSPESKSKGWSDNISVSRASESDDAVSPSFSVTLPLSEKDMHKMLEIDAYMTVTYPSNNGNGTFSNPSEQLSRHYQLFQVSRQDMVLREKLTHQKSQMETNKDIWEHRTTNLGIGITFTAASLLFAVIAYIVYKSAKASRPA